MVIHVINASSRAYPMLLFAHLKIYVWSPLVYIPFDRYGLYPAIEMAGISPAFVLKINNKDYHSGLGTLAAVNTSNGVGSKTSV